VTLAIDPTAIGRVVENQLTVSSDGTDSVAANNVAVVSTNVTPTKPETDLAVTQFTSSAPTITRNNPVTLNGIIVNNGRSTATNILIETKFSGLSGTVTVRSATLTGAGCSAGGSSIVCYVGTFPKNSPKNLSITIVPSNAGTLTAEVTAQVNPLENDPNTSNNVKSLNVTVN
jgi:hypothetical protein